MRRRQKNIKLTSYNELLGISEKTDECMDKVIEVPLTEVHSFKNHPFHVLDDEKMADTVESIRNFGVLNPALVRPRSDGGYELIAGHRRKRGCELAGRDTMPVIVRNYSDDEAVIIMVDSNIQRENIQPSEKAFAYKMKMEAFKHQGVKTGSGNDVETADLVGKEAGDSGRKVQRYIRLTELLPGLLELVDIGKIKVSPAVSLSYLSKKEQEWVLKCVIGKETSVTGSIADRLKKYSENKELSDLTVELIMCGERQEHEKITLSSKVRQYFPKNYNNQKIEEIIINLLKDWKSRQ